MMNSSIRLTKRDELVLQFINTFGFCEIHHIQKQFGIKKRQSYSVMERLIKADLLNHQIIYHQQHGIYFLTKKGATFTDFPPLNVIPHNHYHHHLTVIHVYQKLKQQYADMVWISERQLIQEKFEKGVGQKGHIADGMMLLPDKKIAIEVELTVKGKSRIEGILREYAKELHINEVWYFCQPKTYSALQEFIQKMTFVKTIPLMEFLHAETQPN